MADDFLIPFSEYRYLQRVLHEGPLPAPQSGPEQLSVSQLIDKGLLEIVAEHVAVTLRGALAAVAAGRAIDDQDVAIDRALLLTARELEFGSRAASELAEQSPP